MRRLKPQALFALTGLSHALIGSHRKGNRHTAYAARTCCRLGKARHSDFLLQSSDDIVSELAHIKL